MRTPKIQYGGQQTNTKNDNHPATQEAWNAVKEIAKKRTLQQETFRSRCILRC